MLQFYKDIQENELVVATLNRKILKDVLEKNHFALFRNNRTPRKKF